MSLRTQVSNGLILLFVSAAAARALGGASADLSITNVGEYFVPAGLPTHYVVTVSNLSSSVLVDPATVTDTFSPQCSRVTWTCSGSSGSACAASGVGDIQDPSVRLPPGGSVTYLATCEIPPSIPYTNFLSLATVTGGSILDPNPSNNRAMDYLTVYPRADLTISVTDGVTAPRPGTSVTYTIVASNLGPSDSPTSQVIDDFPSACTRISWTCAGTAGGVCNSSGIGDLQEIVQLPHGSSTSFRATCNLSTTASDLLVNTARVDTGKALVLDPNQENDQATDVDFLSGRAGPMAIPTLDGIGLFLLVGALGALALRRLKSFP